MLNGWSEPLLPPAARAVTVDAIRWLIGAVWWYAAVAKARDSSGLRARIGALLPRRAAAAPNVARALVVTELLLGLALLSGWHEQWAAGVSAGLFGLFAVALVVMDFRTTLPLGGCGCFGRGAVVSEGAPIDTTAPAVARNVILVALAVVVASQS